MIDWLLEVLVPFTVIAGMLILSRKTLLPHIGSQTYYRLYLFIPFTLALPLLSIPNWFIPSETSAQMAKMLVIANEQMTRYSVYDIALYLWLTGFCVFFGYLMVNHYLLVKQTKNWRQLTETPLTSDVKGLRYRASEDVFSPMLVGLIKPTLVIPEDFEQHYSKEQQALILEHELCHFQRNDLVWNAFALILLALMWFHPLAWLAFRYYRRDQELSCDEIVLARKHTTSRINYSKALVVAAQLTVPVGFAQLSFKEYGDKDVMFERIHFIKNNPKGSMIASLAVMAVLMMSLSAMSFAGSGAKMTKAGGSEVMPVKRIEPVYPQKAVDKKLEGSVVLKFDITPQGDVENVSVIKATPKKVFDKSAKIALRQWKYKPSKAGMKNSLVQLDFLLGPKSQTSFKQVEQIKVTNSQKTAH